MPGYAHIFRLSAREGTYGNTHTEYQFSYNQGGTTWARTFGDEAGLTEFLRSNLGLTRERTGEAVAELLRAGRITIAEVEIPQHEAPTLGLEQMPSDF